MYRCENCDRVVPAGTKAHRRVVATRLVTYPYRVKANRVVRMDDNGKLKVKFVDDPGGCGEQIAKEWTICPTCATSEACDSSISSGD